LNKAAIPDARCAARAIDALRRGWSITVNGPSAAITLRSVETALTADAGYMLISASRAATLKLTNQHAAADTALPVMIALPAGLDAKLDMGEVMAIADPALDLLYPMKGPFAASPLPDAGAAKAAIELARLAGLLPAFVVTDASTSQDQVTPQDIAAYTSANNLVIAARAKLPVSAAPDARITAFRSDADATEHVALVIGVRDETPPIVRLHSECLTGDVLGSLKCDCGPQLHEALHQIHEGRWGVLLYLRQEGRGIGLINKLRAYALQDQGFDTVDANTRLGFAIDARDFGIAAQMLRLLGIDKVRLLTNNPLKVAGLEQQGISVTERLPLKIAANQYNQDYLDTKKTRTGHQL
jgi:GTP cyclohydrolase II